MDIIIRVSPDKPYWEHVTERLSAYGITQRQLAEQMGVEESVLSRWVNQRTEPKLSYVVRLEQAIQELLAARRGPPRRRKSSGE